MNLKKLLSEKNVFLDLSGKTKQGVIEEMIDRLIDSGLIMPLDRFVLIGAHLCPICKIES